MKKLKITILALCLTFAVIVTAVTLTGCNDDTKIQAVAAEPVELGAVSLDSISYDGTSLSWGGVSHADLYEVTVGEEEVKKAETNSLSLPLAATFTVKIRALASDGNKAFLSCKTATEQTFTYVAPPEIRLKDRSFVWEEISSAKGYVVMENGTVHKGYQNKDNCSFELIKGSMDENGVNATLKVKPVFESKTTFSQFSEQISATILDKPQNLVYDGEILTWDEVKGADSYKVEVFKNGESMKEPETVYKTEYVFDSRGDNSGVDGNSQVKNESFECRITAIGNESKNVLNSVTSILPFIYVLPCQNLNIEEGVLTWESQVIADYYEISVKRSSDSEETIVKSVFNYYDGLIPETSYTVKVRPKSNSGNIFSTWSVPFVCELLATPETTFDGEKIIWNKNEKASGYKCIRYVVNNGYAELSEDGDGIPEGETTLTVNYETMQPGRYIYQIVALSIINGVYQSKPSDALTFIKLAQPSAYFITSAETYNEEGEIAVHFNAVQVDVALDNVTGCEFAREDLGIYYTAGLYQSNDETNSNNLSQKSSDKDDVTLTYKQEMSDKGGAEYKVLITAKSNAHKTFNAEKRLVVFENNNTYIYRLSRLTAPNVTLTGSLLTWERVNKASGYCIRVERTDKGATESEKINMYNTYDLRYDLSYLKAGKYDVSVATMGNGNIVIPSVYSNAIQLVKLPAPTNVRVSDTEIDGQRLVEWDFGVDGSVYYDDGEGNVAYIPEGFTIHVGNQILNAEGNRFALSKNDISTNGTAISVYAEGKANKEGEVSTLTSNASNSVENKTEYTFLAFQLHTPTSVVVTDNAVSWMAANGYDANTIIGYNVYVSGTRLINDEISTLCTIPIDTAAMHNNIIYFDDYIDEEASNPMTTMNIQVEAVGKGRYFNSNYSVNRQVTKLAAPQVEINEFTGELTWNKVEALDENGDPIPDVTITGYAVKVLYSEEDHKKYDAVYFLGGEATSFTPVIQPFAGELVSIRVCTVGDGGIYTISSNYVGVKLTKLVSLDKVVTDNDSVTVAVENRSRNITVTIDETKQGDKVTVGNGYGIYIGGVEYPIRRYFEDENLYEKKEGEDSYFYYPSVGEIVTYNAGVYVYKFVAQSHGNFDVRIRALGGNYNTDPTFQKHTAENEIIRYCNSENVDIAKIVLLESFRSSDIVRSNKSLTAEEAKTKTYVQLQNKSDAIEYEYTICFYDCNNQEIGTKVIGKIAANANGTYTDILVEGITSDMYKMKVTARALGNPEKWIFDAASEYTKTLNLR